MGTSSAVHAEAGWALVTGYADYGRMASGAYVYYGAAACPYVLPLGTLVQIDGLGVFRCEDRYASWLGWRFDVWWPTAQQCYDNTGWRTYRILIY